jgi:hypothetical protein
LDNYPQGTKEYVCIRKRYADNTDEEAYWHAYSSPKLWAYKAKDGVVNGFIVNLSDTTFPVGVNEEGKSETDVTIESEVEVFQNSFPYYNYEVELGNNLGWDISSNGLIDVTFTAVMAKNGEPCLSVVHNTTPKEIH